MSCGMRLSDGRFWLREAQPEPRSYLKRAGPNPARHAPILAQPEPRSYLKRAGPQPRAARSDSRAARTEILFEARGAPTPLGILRFPLDVTSSTGRHNRAGSVACSLARWSRGE